MDTNIEGLHCGACGYGFDLTTGLGGAVHMRPSDGALSVCINCANVEVFTVAENGEIGLRRPTEQESAAISQSAQVRKAVSAVQRSRGLCFTETWGHAPVKRDGKGKR